MISDGLNGGGFEYWFWTVMWGLAWIALIASISILIVAFLPEITAALSAIGTALEVVGGLVALLYRQASQLYLTVSISVSSFIEAGIVRSAIFNALIFYAQSSPPPIPVPTDLTGGVMYYLVFRAFLYFGIRDFIRSGYLTIYWRFAANTEIMLSESYRSYLKPMYIMSSAIIKGERYRTYCFT